MDRKYDPEYELNLARSRHYLEVLKLNYSIMQPEIREAIDFALNELKKKYEN